MLPRPPASALHRHAAALLALLSLGAFACAPLSLDPIEPYAFAVYDLSGGQVPTPNQFLVDDEAGQIDLPTDNSELSPAALEVRQWLNTLDSWGTTSPATLEFSEPVDPASIATTTVQVWAWGATPTRVPEAAITLAEDGLSIEIQAPSVGWNRGGTYVLAARGGDGGLKTLSGLPFGPDAAFTLLRHPDPIDGPEHHRAFSGSTREERADGAARVEELRAEIAPFVDFFDSGISPEYERITRDELIALWHFRVTNRVELAMDPDSKRVPLPFDLLIDPDSGLIDIPDADGDRPLELEAKEQLRKLDGFGVSMDLLFELTASIDPATATPANIRLYDISGAPTELPALEVTAWSPHGNAPCAPGPSVEDCRHVQLQLPPELVPLQTDHSYAVAVFPGLTDRDGRPVELMPMGAFLKSTQPLVDGDGASTIGSLGDEDANRLEPLRRAVEPLFDFLGRDNVVGAWPFTTLDPVPQLAADVRRAEDLGLHPVPVVTEREPAWALFGDSALGDLFPGALNPAPEVYIARTIGVGEVIHGTIAMPSFLDPITRAWREDDGYEEVDVPFLATVPGEFWRPSGPMRVVVFAHAIVTDRRFLLTIAGELSRRGFATVAIDLPFHGTRSACVDSSLVAVPNILPEELQDITGLTDNLLYLPPCESGAAATCSPKGQCLDPDGNVEDFAHFPIIDMLPVSGAAFLDMEDIAHVPDRVRQALSDLGTLRYSLQSEHWEGVFSHPVRTESLMMAGQSLGAILSSVFISVEPSIDRFVLNVPGSNLVDLFHDSFYFGPQIAAFLEHQDIEDPSWDKVQLLAVATWLVDSVDPHSTAHLFNGSGRPGVIQMDRVADGLGDFVIPNYTTESLQRASGLPIIEYPSVLHADLIVPLIGDPMMVDLAAFLDGDLDP